MIYDKVVLIENFSFLKINVSKFPHKKLKKKVIQIIIIIIIITTEERGEIVRSTQTRSDSQHGLQSIHKQKFDVQAT